MLAFYLSMLGTEEEKLTFESIYEKLSHSCYCIALNITRNHNLAEDAVHDAFLSVIKHKNKIFDLPCENRASLIVFITKNKALDILRREKIRSHENFDCDDELPLHTPDVAKLIEDEETYQHLLSAISSLPEKYKAVSEMKYISNMDNTEIGKMLGIKPQAVSMRINRAKNMLREALNQRE